MGINYDCSSDGLHVVPEGILSSGPSNSALFKKGELIVLGLLQLPKAFITEKLHTGIAVLTFVPNREDQ